LALGGQTAFEWGTAPCLGAGVLLDTTVADDSRVHADDERAPAQRGARDQHCYGSNQNRPPIQIGNGLTADVAERCGTVNARTTAVPMSTSPTPMVTSAAMANDCAS
jgi:hypothetical protein